jgi:23S rRNA pseudouridine2605 synthase
MSERLHKLLAQHGLGSRREIEKWMLAGRVLLNGKPAQPGDRYAEGDRVIVDGQDVTARLQVASKAAVIAYHKPQGQPITARVADEPEAGAADETVMERLPAVRGSRWLVINTMQPGDSGLLMLTTDGRLADALRRRSEKISSAYVARVLVPTPEFDPATISRVVQFDNQTVEFDSIEPAGGEGTNRWFRVEASHAHRRAAVRALFEISGLKVSRVIQVKFADIELPRDLPRGKHRVLADEQVDRLYEFAELKQPAEPLAQRGGRRPAFRSVGGRASARPRKSSNRPSRPAPPVDREVANTSHRPMFKPDARRASKSSYSSQSRPSKSPGSSKSGPGRPRTAAGRKPTGSRRSDR